MSELHPSQIEHYHRTHLLANATSWGLLLLLAGLLSAGTLTRPPALRSLLFGLAWGVGIATGQVRKIAIETERIGDDIQDISHTALQQFLYESMRPGAEPVVMDAEVISATQDEDDSYDVADILSENVGICLLGNSGSGKSSVCQYIISLMGETQILILDPHDDGKTWGDLPVISSYPNILEQLQLLLKELDDRREKRRRGEKFQPIAVVCDEWPSIRLYCEKQKSPVADEFVLRMGSECRKFAMLTIFCSQSGNVKAMGLEGQGDFLENFLLVRLNKVAKKYAKNLTDRTILQRLKQSAYCCLVGDAVAYHPTHGHHQRVYDGATPASLQQLRSLPLSVPTVLPVPFLQPAGTQNPPVQPLNQQQFSSESPTQIEPFEPDDSDIVNRLNRLYDLSRSHPELNDSVQSEGPKSPHSDDSLRSRIAELKLAGLNQNQIILAIWQAKAGGSKAYRDAVAEYRRIVGEGG